MNNKMSGKFLVWGYRENDILSSISVKIGGNNDLISSITIPPVNRMVGKFDVLERPLERFYLNPVKDSTIRENLPTLNYGNDRGMLVGKDEYNGEIFRSLIQFDLSSIPANKVLKKAILRVYNSPFSRDMDLSIFNLLSNWQEKDVTWANQPPQGDKVATKNIGLSQSGFIEIDITNLVAKWYQKAIPNYGLFLCSEDESKLASILFGTRESDNPPELELGFELPVINDGESKLESSITVQVLSEADLLSKIHVISNYREEILRSLIRIEKKAAENLLSAKLNVEVKNNSSILSSMQINKIEDSSSLQSMIVIPDSTDLLSSFTVKKLEKADSLLSSISIRKNEHLLSSLTVEKISRHSDLLLALSVRGNDHLASSITIPHKNDLLGRIRVEYVNELPASIYVKYSDDLLSQMNVIGREQNDLHSSITVQVKMASDLLSSMRVVDVSSKSNYQYAFII
ncbi:DNRLRE domain-containing protein [Brevibacillus brevis]|uniref:DNRLRE domain-containing protein n=1 Tax=Brevibacillus brevis TaxID=1393 RepID=UPI0007D899B9|nr:DNRLRE domain-containing protein [Brevibacillus brevis]